VSNNNRIFEEAFLGASRRAVYFIVKVISQLLQKCEGERAHQFAVFGDSRLAILDASKRPPTRGGRGREAACLGGHQNELIALLGRERWTLCLLVYGTPRSYPGLEFQVLEAIGSVIHARQQLLLGTCKPA
jgi:hypothetical protein